MLARATLLRRTAAKITDAIPRRHLAEAAVDTDGTKLKLNFFLPHLAIKSNAEVVRLPAASVISTR